MDLPAPLRPTRAVIVPLLSCRDTPSSTACTAVAGCLSARMQARRPCCLACKTVTVAKLPWSCLPRCRPPDYDGALPQLQQPSIHYSRQLWMCACPAQGRAGSAAVGHAHHHALQLRGMLQAIRLVGVLGAAGSSRTPSCSACLSGACCRHPDDSMGPSCMTGPHQQDTWHCCLLAGLSCSCMLPVTYQAGRNAGVRRRTPCAAPRACRCSPGMSGRKG